MKKSKKIILTIVCIISVLVISAVPCFALDNGEFLSSETLLNYGNKRTILSIPNGMRMYTMGFESNLNNYFLLDPTSKFSLEGTGAAGTYPRLGLYFYFNENLHQPNYPLSIILRDSNTYSMYSYGFYEIQFKLYIAPDSSLGYFDEQGLDVSLNGYRSHISQPTFVRSSDNGEYLRPLIPTSSDLTQRLNSKIYSSSIVYEGRSANAFGNMFQNSERYSVRLIVPVYEGLFALDSSFSLPVYTRNGHSSGYDLQVRNVEITYYSNPDDISNFLYIPDFDSSFQEIVNTEDFFNDNLNESLDNFKNIGTELTSFLSGDLLTSFAVWNQYFNDIFDIDPIRKLLIFSICIGIFTFVVSASNLVVGVTSSVSRKAGKISRDVGSSKKK